MKKCGIYKITNPKNKVYIGASKDILKRWSIHYKHSCNIKAQKKLYNSFKKYEIENHTFEIIEETNEDILFQREIFWIDYYDSFLNGLNLTKGGENPPIQNKPKSEEHKLKIGISNKGKKHSNETKEKIREKRKLQVFSKEHYQNIANKRRGVPSKLKGRKRPTISEKLKGKKSPISIKCKILNKDTLNIYEADSISDLSKIINIPIWTLNKIRKGLNTKIKNYEFIKC